MLVCEWFSVNRNRIIATTHSSISNFHANYRKIGNIKGLQNPVDIINDNCKACRQFGLEERLLWEGETMATYEF
jgi:hypothetical protein